MGRAGGGRATGQSRLSCRRPQSFRRTATKPLVKQALQRYRGAYEGLDAQSAQAVWPAVNEVALARAFDGLESQSLTFDACDVRLAGESRPRPAAARRATCRSRQPRAARRTAHLELRAAEDRRRSGRSTPRERNAERG